MRLKVKAKIKRQKAKGKRQKNDGLKKAKKAEG
jgi:hypothetical protein